MYKLHSGISLCSRQSVVTDSLGPSWTNQLSKLPHASEGQSQRFLSNHKRFEVNYNIFYTTTQIRGTTTKLSASPQKNEVKQIIFQKIVCPPQNV